MKFWPKAVAWIASGALLALTPSPTHAQSRSVPERVFAAASPSIVVVRSGDSQGSGVVIERGVVATNCHVLRDPDRIKVERHGAETAAILVGAINEQDVCLLEAPSLAGPSQALQRSDQLRVGMPVFAIGAPRGLDLTLSPGIVSQLRRGRDGTLVQTNAALAPGSSGGGLFDERGRLVGLVTFRVGSEGFSFATPAEVVERALGQLNDWRACRAAPTVNCMLEHVEHLLFVGAAPASALSRRGQLAEYRAAAGDPESAARSLEEAIQSAIQKLMRPEVLRAPAPAQPAHSSAPASSMLLAIGINVGLLARVDAARAMSLLPNFRRSVDAVASVHGRDTLPASFIAAVLARGGSEAMALEFLNSVRDVWARGDFIDNSVPARGTAATLAIIAAVNDPEERLRLLYSLAVREARDGRREHLQAIDNLAERALREFTARTLRQGQWEPAAAGAWLHLSSIRAFSVGPADALRHANAVPWRDWAPVDPTPPSRGLLMMALGEAAARTSDPVGQLGLLLATRSDEEARMLLQSMVRNLGRDRRFHELNAVLQRVDVIHVLGGTLESSMWAAFEEAERAQNVQAIHLLLQHIPTTSNHHTNAHVFFAALSENLPELRSLLQAVDEDSRRRQLRRGVETLASRGNFNAALMVARDFDLSLRDALSDVLTAALLPN